MFRNGLCKVYVEADMVESELAGRLAGLLDGTWDGVSVTTDCLTLNVLSNDERQHPRTGKHMDDFLFFPWILEILPNDVNNRLEYVAEVSKILRSLWQHGDRAIAACQFEDSLPRHGGRLPG